MAFGHMKYLSFLPRDHLTLHLFPERSLLVPHLLHDITTLQLYMREVCLCLEVIQEIFTLTLTSPIKMTCLNTSLPQDSGYNGDLKGGNFKIWNLVFIGTFWKKNWKYYMYTHFGLIFLGQSRKITCWLW